MGASDLGGRGRGGEGMALIVRGGRRFLFVAHESAPTNFTVLDVSDPRRPEVVAQTDLPHPKVRSNSLAVAHDGALLAVAYQVQQPGERPAGVEFFDISDPLRPRSISYIDTSGPHSVGAHFVWICGQRLFAATGMPDFTPSHPRDHQIVLIVDISNPTQPREVSRWWIDGTGAGDSQPPPVRHPAPEDRGFRAHNINVYPSHPDRAYVGYLDAGVVILDIADANRPRQVGRLDYHPPLPGFTHTVLPLFSRGLLAVTDEALTTDGQDHPKLLWLMDASVESNLVPIATAPLPPFEDFRSRGGRFGAHNLHENDPSPTAWHSEDEVVGAFFSAGIRIYDVRQPFQPREVAHYVPPPPPGSPAGCAQSNDVYVDENHVIYAVDRHTGGLYVLERS
ncbi:MAG: LVIVD repeat-containing protein [Candidatus Dormibacteraceae bacterium]